MLERIITLSLLLLAIILFLGGFCIGIGFLLQFCLPSLQFDHAIIAGSIIGIASIHYFFKICTLLSEEIEKREKNELEKEDIPIILYPNKIYSPHKRSYSKKRKRGTSPENTENE